MLWNENEDALYGVGLLLHGSNLASVASSFLPHRTVTQLNNRFINTASAEDRKRVKMRNDDNDDDPPKKSMHADAAKGGALPGSYAPPLAKLTLSSDLRMFAKQCVTPLATVPVPVLLKTRAMTAQRGVGSAAAASSSSSSLSSLSSSSRKMSSGAPHATSRTTPSSTNGGPTGGKQAVAQLSNANGGVGDGVTRGGRAVDKPSSHGGQPTGTATRSLSKKPAPTGGGGSGASAAAAAASVGPDRDGAGAAIDDKHENADNKEEMYDDFDAASMR